MDRLNGHDPDRSGSTDHTYPYPAGTRRAPRRSLDPTSWRARVRRPLISATTIGLIWATSAFYFVWTWENALAQRELASVAQNHLAALQNGLDDYLAKLATLRALFEANNGVTRREFAIFTRRLVENEAAIQNFTWVPRVSSAERTDFEQAARRDGVPNFGIKAISSDDRPVPAPEQDEYLPVLYSSVAMPTSAIYGIDLRGQPAVSKRLDEARDRDQLSVVPDFVLHSLDGRVHAFLFSLPVYRAGRPHETVADRRANLLGFVHGAFLTDIAFEHIIATSTSPSGLNIYLFSADAGPDTPPLHRHTSRLGGGSADAASFAAATHRRHYQGEITAGNAHWIMVAEPVAGGPLEITHDRAWLVLAASLLIGALALFHIHSSSRQARRLVAANAQISELAQTDALTGLMNRRAFTEQLDAAFTASQNGAAPIAILYFDLDRFKDVNDTLGHPVGDRLLCLTAERVRGAVRPGDVIARLGGDEFAVLLTGVRDFAPEVIAHKINHRLAAPFEIDGNEVRITASIGIALYTPEITSAEALMVQADLALYRAKEDGRDCYRFHSEELDIAIHERVTVAAELRAAIEQNEMRLFYQPQIDLATGRTIGLEALVRWQHPQRGLIGPASFIPIAERSGSIVQLGQWVLQEACRQLNAWHRQGLRPGVMAVNVSAVQLKSHFDIDRFIAATLARWQIQPQLMEIEVTESVLMEVSQNYGEVFEALRAIGVRTAIDDFGTGYSSLSYLTSYPVNRLKIAQDLTSGVNTDARSATVVRAAIHLAKELGIGCVAEGVETAAQADFLVSAGCEAAQGYYFGAPINAEQMTQRLYQQSSQRPPGAPRLALVSG